MKCVQIENESGEVKVIPSGERYSKEWKKSGVVDCEMQGEKLVTTPGKGSIRLGDLVEQVIKLFPEEIRPQHCSKCEQRKRALNFIRENGIIETMRKLKEINAGR